MKLRNLFMGLALAPIFVIISVLFTVPVKAGPMDNGPHVLVVWSTRGGIVAVAQYDSKEQCLAVAADIRENTDFIRAHCVPGKRI